MRSTSAGRDWERAKASPGAVVDEGSAATSESTGSGLLVQLQTVTMTKKDGLRHASRIHAGRHSLESLACMSAFLLHEEQISSTQSCYLSLCYGNLE